MVGNISKTNWLSSALTLTLCVLCLATAYRYASMIVMVCCLLLLGIGYGLSAKEFNPLQKKEKGLIFALIFFFVSALLSYIVGNGWELKSIRNPSMPSLIDLDLPSKYLLGALLFYGFMKLKFRLCKVVICYAIGLGGIINGMIGVYERYILGYGRIDGFSGIAEMADASAILGIFALILFIFSQSNKERVFYAFSAFMACFATLLTGTRGAIFGLVLTGIFIGIVIIWKKREAFKPFLWGILACILSFGVVIVASGGIKDAMRIERATQDLQAYQQGDIHTSLGARFEMWKEAVAMFQMAPFFGLSTAEIKQRMGEILQKSGSKIQRVATHQEAIGKKHNQILNAAAKRGIVGVLAIALVWFACIQLFANFLKGQKNDFVFSLCALSMIFYFIFPNSLTGDPWESNVSIPLMFLLFCVFYKLIKQSQENAN